MSNNGHIYIPIEGDISIRELFTGKFQVSRYLNRSWQVQPLLLSSEDALALSRDMQQVHTVSEDYAMYRPRDIEPSVLRIPVEPVSLPCSECGSENFPNYRYELVGLSGVLCKHCLNKELATINAVLSNEQEDRGYDEDFLEAKNKE